MKVKIVPTILTQNFTEFKKRLQQLEPFFKFVQIDCADGKFVKNKTFYKKSEICNLKSEISYELHLMVKEPFKEIKKWEKFKKLKRIIFHFEAINNKKILEIVDYLHKKGIEVGLAINPSTKLAKVVKLLPLVDALLFLGVKPGWGGQKFQVKVLTKIKQARKLFPELNIAVDGGINLDNAKQIINAGANILVIGKSLNSDAAIIKFKSIR